jgi:hypothetical protein
MAAARKVVGGALFLPALAFAKPFLFLFISSSQSNLSVLEKLS